MGQKPGAFYAMLPCGPRSDSSKLCIRAPQHSLVLRFLLWHLASSSPRSGESNPAKSQLPEDCCWFRLRLGTHSGDCHSTRIGALSFQRHLGKNGAETWAAATASAEQFCSVLLDFLEAFFRNDITDGLFKCNTLKWSDLYSFFFPHRCLASQFSPHNECGSQSF